MTLMHTINSNQSEMVGGIFIPNFTVATSQQIRLGVIRAFSDCGMIFPYAIMSALPPPIW